MSPQRHPVDQPDRRPSDVGIVHYGPKAYADHPPFSYPDYRSTVLRAPRKDMVRIVQTLSEPPAPAQSGPHAPRKTPT